MAEASKRIVFLCSGGGGNLRFVHRAVQQGWIAGAAIAAVLTDRACAANGFARAQGIPERVLDFGQDRQQEVLAALQAAQPDLVVTTVHRILGPAIVGAFRGRLLNLHYSLLPAFGGTIGAKPVQAALDYGARFVGVTAHEVDETVDGGRPLVQAAIPVRADDDAQRLMDLVFRCGCIALASAIDAGLHRRPLAPEQVLPLMGRQCTFSAPAGIPPELAGDETFWAAIAAQPSGAAAA